MVPPALEKRSSDLHHKCTEDKVVLHRALNLYNIVFPTSSADSIVLRLLPSNHYIESYKFVHKDDLAQDCFNPNLLAMELPQSCAEPSICPSVMLFISM